MKPLFDNYNTKYDRVIEQSIGFLPTSHDFYLKAKVDLFIQRLQFHFDSINSCSVLDFGCGIGKLDHLLQPHLGQLSGLDISSQSIETASKLNPLVNYSSYDGNVVPYHDDAFDAIIVSCVMHHISKDNRLQTLKEIYRLLKPGGIIAIFEHNPINPLTQWVVMRCEFDKDADLLFRKESISLLKQSGFSSLYSDYLLYLPFPFPRPAKLQKLRRLIPFGAQYLAEGQKQ